MHIQYSIVAVFKTSVTKKELSEKIKKEMLRHPHVLTCNFDLTDCDNILRIESKAEMYKEVIAHLNAKGLSCEELI